MDPSSLVDSLVPRTRQSVIQRAAGLAILIAAGAFMPHWLTFLITIAAARGLVSLGIMLLMRCGTVSFGQGMVFAVGGYSASLAATRLGLSDAFLLTLLGGSVAALAALPVAPLIARYRGIFFAMLTLALSMVVYGILVKADALGGSDGFNMRRPTVLGYTPDDAHAGYVLYAATLVMTGLASLLVRIHADSARGLMALAVRGNEIRVEYLGASVRRIIAQNFVAAAFLAGMGGALTVMVLGHIDPTFAYWTSSGEFVFVAILAGYQSDVAIFAASLILEVVRSFSSLYFPNTWQLALGLFLLAVIRFVPQGLGSLFGARAAKKEAQT